LGRYLEFMKFFAATTKTTEGEFEGTSASF